MTTTQGFKRREEKRGGILGWLSSLLNGSGAQTGAGAGSLGGGALSGGAGSAAGGGGGLLGGLFATKAGIMGAILGCATIAAGIGVVYNFMGPSSQPVYRQGMFQENYERKMVDDAARERAQTATSSVAAAKNSSLDYFRQEAKALAGPGEQAPAAPKEEAKKSDDGSADAPAAVAPEAASGGAGAGAAGTPLQKDPAFRAQLTTGLGGAMKQLAGGAGLSGGVGQNFQQMKFSPAPAAGAGGQLTAMKGGVNAKPVAARSIQAGVRGRGAYGQAKSVKAVVSSARGADMAPARAGIVQAYEGGSTGTGTDLTGVPTGGTSTGDSPGVNANVPNDNIDTKESTPPSPAAPANATPWKKWSTIAMIGTIVSALLIAITSKLAKNPASKKFAIITGMLAMAAAGLVIAAGMILLQKYGQKSQGYMYLGIGAMLEMAAMKAMRSGQSKDAKGAANGIATDANAANIQPGYESAGSGFTGGAGAAGG